MCILAAAGGTASGAAAAHQFVLIAESGAELGEIQSAALGQAGHVAFDVVGPGGQPMVYYLIDDGTPTPVPGFIHAHSPAVDGSGRIAFIADDGDPGVYLFDPLAADLTLLDSVGSEILTLGQVSVNDSGIVAYWTLTCIAGCAQTQHCLAMASGGLSLGGLCQDDLTEDCFLLTGPALDDAGTLSFLSACNDARRIQRLSDGRVSTLFTVSAEGTLTPPSVSPSGVIGTYAADPGAGVAAGIYLIEAEQATLAVDLSGPAMLPSVHTRPVVASPGMIAFPAQAVGVEAIFTGPDAVEDRLIGVGDSLFGAAVAGQLRVDGITPLGEILFRTLLDDGREVLALAVPGLPTCASADFTGNGVVGVDDLLMLLANWGLCPPEQPQGCVGDVDGDGVVDEVDLNLLLDFWGPCETQ